MTSLRTRAASLIVLALALAATIGVFTFARPKPSSGTIPPPPGTGISYTKVVYNAADAQRAFANVGITLIRHTHEPQPAKATPIIDMSTTNLIVVVDAFGNPAKIKASGFSDYVTFTDGHWVRTPANCANGATAAERWRANIRVIINCSLAGNAAPTWLRRASLALTRL